LTIRTSSPAISSVLDSSSSEHSAPEPILKMSGGARPKTLRPHKGKWKAKGDEACATTYFTRTFLNDVDPVVSPGQLIKTPAVNKLWETLHSNKPNLIKFLCNAVNQVFISSVDNSTPIDCKAEPSRIAEETATTVRIWLSFHDTQPPTLDFTTEDLRTEIDFIATKVDTYLNKELTELLGIFESKLGYNQSDDSNARNLKSTIVKITEPFLDWACRTADATVRLGLEKGLYDRETGLSHYINNREGQAKTEAHASGRIDNLCAQVAALTTMTTEAKYTAVNNRINVKKVGSLATSPYIEGDRANRCKREGEIHFELVRILKFHGAHKINFSTFIVDPKPNTTQSVLAIITFALSDDVFTFERFMAIARKAKKDGGGYCEATTTRYTPFDDPASNIPPLDSIRRMIIGFYKQKLSADVDKVRNSGGDTKSKEMDETHDLGENFDLICMKATENKPFRIFWEFLCPTSNVAFIKFTPGKTPFEFYDFAAAIPNPDVRAMASTDAAYAKSYRKEERKKK
jgi:hypothetical protein